MHDHTAPRGDLTAATLTFARGATEVRLRAEEAPEPLFTARFTGNRPAVSVARGTVTVRYRFGPGRRAKGDIALSTHVAWAIRVQGGVGGLDADLTRIALTSLDVEGGASRVTLRLAPPLEGRVPIRIGGGASRVTLLRPAGVAARVHVSRGAAHLVFDGQHFGAIGGDIQLESPPGEPDTGRYHIDIASGASHLTVAGTAPGA